jgi:hypothetical protein
MKTVNARVESTDFTLKDHEKYITYRLETVPSQKNNAQKRTSDFLQDDRIHRKRSSLLSLSVSSRHINKVFKAINVVLQI